MADIFPDYPVTDLPAIPQKWKNATWHNDACPSYRHNGLRIWVDYRDPNRREWPSATRYQIVPDTEDGDNAGLSLLETNNWDEVLLFVASYRQR